MQLIITETLVMVVQVHLVIIFPLLEVMVQTEINNMKVVEEA